jgi:hypothetical protein
MENAPFAADSSRCPARGQYSSETRRLFRRAVVGRAVRPADVEMFRTV